MMQNTLFDLDKYLRPAPVALDVQTALDKWSLSYFGKTGRHTAERSGEQLSPRVVDRSFTPQEDK